jgi:hypothetical protein
MQINQVVIRSGLSLYIIHSGTDKNICVGVNDGHRVYFVMDVSKLQYFLWFETYTL